jgi:hypothetical protein
MTARRLNQFFQDKAQVAPDERNNSLNAKIEAGASEKSRPLPMSVEQPTATTTCSWQTCSGTNRDAQGAANLFTAGPVQAQPIAR